MAVPPPSTKGTDYRNNRFPAFRTSIQSLFKEWTALRLAVDNSKDTNRAKEIAIWMESAVEDYFYDNDDLIGDEVAEFLGVIIDQEFNTLIEDNSLEDMGESLCKYFQMCINKKEVELLEILSKAERK